MAKNIHRATECLGFKTAQFGDPIETAIKITPVCHESGLETRWLPSSSE